MNERLMALAADMFHSETRRGWIANNCSAVGDVDPNITKQDYIERFLEKHADSDIDKLEEKADIARPSNLLTTHERELVRAGRFTGRSGWSQR